MNIKPTGKMQAVGIGGAIATVLVWLAQQAGLTVPGEVGAAIGVIIAWVAGWAKIERNMGEKK